MTFTSEEVFAQAHREANETGDMLTAYAELLSQIERAEPYRYTWAKEPDADGVFHKIPLYAHPSADRLVTTNPAPHAAAPSTPSKTVQMEVGCAPTTHADRLAEALRLLKEIKEQTPKGSGVAYASMDQLEALETMLAAHVQEPSVPDRSQK